MAVVIDTPVQHNPRQEDVGQPIVEPESNEEFLAAVLGEPRRLHHLSRSKLWVAKLPDGTNDRASYQVATVSLGVQTLHRCFAAHVPFALTPDTAWYMIVHEVAEFVKQHAEQYAHLFTSTPGEKQLIQVRDDSLDYDGPSDWERSINFVRDPLRRTVTDRTMELFLPTFSTSTTEDETALLVAFMDTVSPYYAFKWQTLCGIPQVRLDGDADDWAQLYGSASQLATEINGLSGYFGELLLVLETIARTAAGETPDDEFWHSIYKYGGGSGGPYVNGWITAFFAHVPTGEGMLLKQEFDWRSLLRRPFGGFGTNDFPSHASKVPFVWEYYGREIPMAFAAGMFGVDEVNGFMTPRLGYAVVEV